MTNRLEQAVGLGEVIEPVLRGTQAWPTSGSVMGGVVVKRKLMGRVANPRKPASGVNGRTAPMSAT